MVGVGSIDRDVMLQGHCTAPGGGAGEVEGTDASARVSIPCISSASIRVPYPRCKPGKDEVGISPLHQLRFDSEQNAPA